uniref:P-type ATPase A domain-containing protein n=1 Tax=Hyaloperonospora arabidopsidis (strain Emoy2) TaxID=559515 RepID=M4BUK0_HYAAE
MTRRTLYGTNRVTPPVNCPAWICCLLPCLMRKASMQLYHKMLPRESTVRRQVLEDGTKKSTRSLRMDAMSLVYGDVVELKVGDVAGADLRVVKCSTDCEVDQTTLVGDDTRERGRGCGTRKQVTTDRPPFHLEQDPLRCGNIVPMTATVLQGTAVAVVVATGDSTIWGQMIALQTWPVAPGTVNRDKKMDDDEEMEDEQTNLIV